MVSLWNQANINISETMKLTKFGEALLEMQLLQNHTASTVAELLKSNAPMDTVLESFHGLTLGELLADMPASELAQLRQDLKGEG